MSGIFPLCAQNNLQPHYQLIEKNGHQIHLLEIDPKRYKIIVATHQNGLVRDTVFSLVTHYGALAGINGGFFKIDNSQVSPAGVLKIKGQWIGLASYPRAAIGWNDDNNQILVDRILTKVSHPKSKRVVNVFPQVDRSNFSKKRWEQFENIVGGTPLLIKNGKVFDKHAIEKTGKSFLDERHARTAVCIKNNHNWIFLVASHTKEPNRPYAEIVEGLTIPELTQFLKQLGCRDAINLDGGGSSTLVMNDKVMNKQAGDMDDITHFYHQRPVLDAILIFPR